MSDFLKYSKKNLQSVGKASADEDQETMRAKKDLQKRWKEMTNTESGASGQKWSKDVEVLKKEVKAFEGRLGEDKELGRVRKAHEKFAMDLEEMMINAAGTGMQLALDQASWMWQDLFNVYLPRAMNMVQSIPIPRYVHQFFLLVVVELVNADVRIIAPSTRTPKSNSSSKTSTSPPSPSSPATSTSATSPTSTSPLPPAPHPPPPSAPSPISKSKPSNSNSKKCPFTTSTRPRPSVRRSIRAWWR